jgi:hypothetical protein
MNGGATPTRAPGSCAFVGDALNHSASQSSFGLASADLLLERRSSVTPNQSYTVARVLVGDSRRPHADWRHSVCARPVATVGHPMSRGTKLLSPTARCRDRELARSCWPDAVSGLSHTAAKDQVGCSIYPSPGKRGALGVRAWLTFLTRDRWLTLYTCSLQ